MDRETAKQILLSNISTYLEQKGINIHKNFNCLCPEHIDNVPSMHYYKKTNSCHCFSCGANANIFKLIEWDYNTTSFKETFDLACDLFGLEVDERPKHQVPQIRPVSQKKFTEKRQTNIDVDVCNKVYQAMRDALPLSDDDIKYLKESRHLDEKRIKADYFRMVSDSEKRKEVVEKIKKITGYDNDVLKNVPGFFLKKEDNQLDYYKDSGIGILIRNVDGRAHAIQIRRDTSEKGRRYGWFSSSFAGGNSPGAAKDVIIPEKPKNCICITEGRFKAEAIAHEGNIVISIQGVSTWKGIDNIIKKIQERYPICGIYLMFDSDVMGNPQLIRNLQDMAKQLKCSFPQLRLMSGIWKMDMGKGIDDCIFNGFMKEVRYIDAIYYFDTCLHSMDELLDEHGIKNVRKMNARTQKCFKKLLQKKNEETLFST